MGELIGSASAYVEGGVEPYSYLWNNNETTPYMEFLPEGEYTLVVTDANGCTVSGSVVVNGVVLTSDYLQDFRVYPNPTSSILLIYLNSVESYQIEVRDFQGHRLPVSFRSQTKSSVELDVRELKTGFYFVKLYLEDGSSLVRKFVKI